MRAREERAPAQAACSPGDSYLAAFVVGLTMPVALAGVLLVLACRSRVDANETIEELIRLRLASAAIAGKCRGSVAARRIDEYPFDEEID